MANTPKKNRRQFLKNTSLSALGITLLPQIGTAKPKPKPKGKQELQECDATTLDYYGEGPFYTENPPSLTDGRLASIYEPGEPLIISGRVFNLDCSEYIPNTVIDLWHADDDGAYDNEGYNLRGKITTNDQGFYVFETIKPGHYRNGSQFRPAHIHVKVTPPGFDTITTQIYFEGDPYIEVDAAASITNGNYDASHRIIPLSKNAEGKWEGTWDIVVNGEGIPTGLQDIHLDKGMIYEVNPNPFTDSLHIRYGVFRPSKVSLLVYDIQGKLVANLEENTLTPEKYEAIWQPSPYLPDGHYFVALKINDLQVHYLKVIKVKSQ